MPRVGFFTRNDDARPQESVPTMVADGQSKACKEVAQPMLPPNDRAGAMQPATALDDTSSSSHNFRMYSFKVCRRLFHHDCAEDDT